MNVHQRIKAVMERYVPGGYQDHDPEGELDWAKRTVSRNLDPDKAISKTHHRLAKELAEAINEYPPITEPELTKAAADTLNLLQRLGYSRTREEVMILNPRLRRPRRSRAYARKKS